MFEHLSFGDSLVISLLGMGIVFAVLVFLILIISAMSAAVRSMSKPKLASPDPVAPVIERARMAQAAPGMVPAPGSIGEVDLHTVDDRTAAMLMAIVADDLGCEPNELSFISIKEL